jgi:hypothetical protein
MLAAVLALVCVAAVTGFARAQNTHFVPNKPSFWNDSKNWTTNYGPAFRDTVQGLTYLLPCTEQFALCFHSGPDPYPCQVTPNGKYANCTCTVQTDTNYVLTSAILNYNVYLETVAACGADGSQCSTPDSAPVCAELTKGKLIPGSKVISTFDTQSRQDIINAIEMGSGSVTQCDGPYAACMTAGCRMKKDGNATCNCPVFWGRFQLIGSNSTCDLGNNLVPSASYNPLLDPNLPN